MRPRVRSSGSLHTGNSSRGKSSSSLAAFREPLSRTERPSLVATSDTGCLASVLFPHRYTWNEETPTPYSIGFLQTFMSDGRRCVWRRNSGICPFSFCVLHISAAYCKVLQWFLASLITFPSIILLQRASQMVIKHMKYEFIRLHIDKMGQSDNKLSTLPLRDCICVPTTVFVSTLLYLPNDAPPKIWIQPHQNRRNACL